MSDQSSGGSSLRASHQSRAKAPCFGRINSFQAQFPGLIDDRRVQTRFQAVGEEDGIQDRPRLLSQEER